jgi:hypothetical protein
MQCYTQQLLKSASIRAVACSSTRALMPKCNVVVVDSSEEEDVPLEEGFRAGNCLVKSPGALNFV